MDPDAEYICEYSPFSYIVKGTSMDLGIQQDSGINSGDAANYVADCIWGNHSADLSTRINCSQALVGLSTFFNPDGTLVNSSIYNVVPLPEACVVGLMPNISSKPQEIVSPAPESGSQSVFLVGICSVAILTSLGVFAFRKFRKRYNG